MGFFDRIFGRDKSTSSSNITLRPSGKFQVEDAYNICGVGVVLVGTVISGQIRGKDIGFAGSKQFTVKTIEMEHRLMDVATVGNKIGISTKGIRKTDILKGTVIDFFIVY